MLAGYGTPSNSQRDPINPVFAFAYRFLYVIVALLVVGDSHSTWICLTFPDSGLYESNPIYASIMGILGVHLTIILATIAKILTLRWFYCSPYFPMFDKVGILLLTTVLYTWVVYSNYSLFLDVAF